jgi:hypothetical protein
VRKLVIELVLATDMKQHFAICTQLRSKLAAAADGRIGRASSAPAAGAGGSAVPRPGSADDCGCAPAGENVVAAAGAATGRSSLDGDGPAAPPLWRPEDALDRLLLLKARARPPAGFPAVPHAFGCSRPRRTPRLPLTAPPPRRSGRPLSNPLNP